MNATPATFPTTSDISQLMRELGYQWSNEAQTFYGFNYDLISDRTARRLYKVLIGDKPYSRVTPSQETGV